jgi:hypothetical protein
MDLPINANFLRCIRSCKDIELFIIPIRTSADAQIPVTWVRKMAQPEKIKEKEPSIWKNLQ